MKIVYKKTTLDDIQQTQQYIAKELHNPKAAKSLTERIVHEISQLSQNPYMGVPLSSKYEVDTDIRILIVARQLVFYRVAEDCRVEIIRVLDGRQDYLALLF